MKGPMSQRCGVVLLVGYHLTATEQRAVNYEREGGWTLDLRKLIEKLKAPTQN